MQKKLMWKTLTVVILCLLSMIPLALVRGVIGERQMLRNGVVDSLERETVGSQMIKGPVLIVPFTRRYTEKTREKRDGEMVEVRREKQVSGTLHLLPEVVEIVAHAQPEERRRGIYTAQAYSGDWQVKGRFVLPPNFGVGKSASRYTFHKAELDFGISDPRGLSSEVALTWNNAPAMLEAGTNAAGLGRGVHAIVNTAAAAKGREQIVEFSLRFGLTGLSRMRFLPLGRDSSVTLTSEWPHPGFFGPLLAKHQIADDGFKAHWQTSFLANNLHREYAACFDTNQCGTLDAAAFGVSLVQPVDLYQQLERATKYGLLFVGLTFMMFFLFDVLKQRPIHPLQYGLVGGALIVFYLLVTSLSEHVAFAWSYAVAAIACVSLIGFYVSSVLGSWQRGGLISIVLATLYGVLYVILQSEDNALLMGSCLLFALIAAVMIGTRKIDWYALGSAQGNSNLSGMAPAS